MEKTWAGTTYGNKWMHKWLIKSLRFIDVRFLYVFSALFIIPFCLIFNSSNKFTYQYFRKRFRFSAIKSVWYTYKNFYRFSQTVIDKFAMYAGKKFDVEIEGYEHFSNLAQKEKGFVQLSSHIGNYEIAGYTLVAKEKAMYAIVYGNEKESIMKNRDSMFSETNIHMIPVKDDMSHLFTINNALNDGNIVSIPADRILGSSKALTIDFLGHKAKFPLGPFTIATIKEYDVLYVTVMKIKAKKYKITVHPLHYDKNASRKEQIAELSKAYVSVTEKTLRDFPTQWYNYFDFWKI